MGTTTAKAAADAGFRVNIVPQKHIVEDLAEEIAKYLKDS
jgi:uroporphyrinogen-III synthase